MGSMPSHDLPRVESVSAQLDRVLRDTPNNVPAICMLGAEALRGGDAPASDRAFRRAVEILLACIRARDATNALAVEAAIYPAFVKPVEDEDHSERCFALWREPLAGLGRELRGRIRPLPQAPAAPGRIGFIFHSGVVLGHTEVLFRLLESCDRRAIDPRIYVIESASAEFRERAARLGVTVAMFPEQPPVPGRPFDFVPRILGIRERLAQDGVERAVWVATPVSAAFAFGVRMAPVQAFWTLRYHGMHTPDVDGYLTYGSWSEAQREFHGQAWTVCPVPLALEARTPGREAVAALRARFPEKVLLGTLAREEKINSAPFLDAIARILERHPECGFVWTGRDPHPGIARFLGERGVGARCHFVGWVDTPLHAAALDVFLESFPLGCGITGYQALAAGVPVLSYLDRNTIFGMQYWNEVAGGAGPATRERLDQYPLLCARDADDYVALASRLIADRGFRDAWTARETAFYREEIAGIARYSRRFFDTVLAIPAREGR